MSTVTLTKHRHLLRWVLFLISFGSIPLSIKAECQAHPNFVACIREIPRLEHLMRAGQSAHVMISDYDGELQTNIPEGHGNYSVKSLQLTKAKISNIQPRFFARLSNNRLGHLAFSTVTGNVYLDSGTLGGLENSLHTLYVVGPEVKDVSYLAKLSQLGTLSLIRTSLTELPNSFVSVLRRAEKLDLSSNRLVVLPWGEVAKRIEDISFTELKLANNQWHCDCSLKPVVMAPLDAKRKIHGFECYTPADLATLPLQALTLDSICPELPVQPSDKQPIAPGSNNAKPDAENEIPDFDGQSGGSNAGAGDLEKPVVGAQGEEVKLATAGGMSTEVIAVIIAVVIVVLIVLIAVIVFKVRSRSHRQRKQDIDKQPSHKSSAYCHVIEHPNSKSGAQGRSSTTGNSGGTAPPANNYNKDLDDSERQPLAPPYYSRDPRL